MIEFTLMIQLAQNKKRRKTAENDATKTNAAGAVTRKRKVPKQKRVDKVLIDNLAEHDQNVIAFEAARKEALKQELRIGLENQLKQRQEKRAVEAQAKHLESQLVDPRIGNQSFRPLRNYDQRPDIELKTQIKTHQVVDERDTDREMVQKLDK